MHKIILIYKTLENRTAWHWHMYMYTSMPVHVRSHTQKTILHMMFAADLQHVVSTVSAAGKASVSVSKRYHQTHNPWFFYGVAIFKSNSRGVSIKQRFFSTLQMFHCNTAVFSITGKTNIWCRRIFTSPLKTVKITLTLATRHVNGSYHHLHETINFTSAPVPNGKGLLPLKLVKPSRCWLTNSCLHEQCTHSVSGDGDLIEWTGL